MWLFLSQGNNHKLTYAGCTILQSESLLASAQLSTPILARDEADVSAVAVVVSARVTLN